MKEMICICCPLGCRMTVEKTSQGYVVQGNTCRRGHDYAIDEMTAPKRTVTTSARVAGGELAVVSVKTSRPVPKEKMFEVIAEVKRLRVQAPVATGDVLIKNVCGCDSDIVATKSVGVCANA